MNLLVPPLLSPPSFSPFHRRDCALLENEKIRHLFGPDAAYNLDPLDKPMSPPVTRAAR